MLEGVEWKQIRSAFIRARGARTQGAIAKAGGLYQSDISKLEANDNLGPAVETFVKAIEGLGISVSSFFAAIEGVISGTEKAGVVGGADSSLRRQDDTLDRRALRADLLHDIGTAIIASAGDIVHEAAAAHRRAPHRGTKSRRPGR